MDNNRTRHHQGRCPPVQNVDAFYFREVGISTKKHFGWQAGNCAGQLCRQQKENWQKVRLALQKIRKGRHLRKAGMKEGIANGAKCTVYVRLVKLQGKWKPSMASKARERARVVWGRIASIWKFQTKSLKFDFSYFYHFFQPILILIELTMNAS